MFTFALQFLAGIAQLVEHDLAKVGVASSSLVSRSNSEARWQSGYAAACKAVYAGSIPTLASNLMGFQPIKLKQGEITCRKHLFSTTFIVTS